MTTENSKGVLFSKKKMLCLYDSNENFKINDNLNSTHNYINTQCRKNITVHTFSFIYENLIPRSQHLQLSELGWVISRALLIL